MPTITVLMPVCNDEKYIRDSIDSVLSQTYTDYEYLIIDDGSTDSTADIIKSYSDPRILFVKNKKNIGLTKSLNMGLDLARGEYIARHDSDDKMDKYRLEKQLDFLNNNKDIAMVGTYWKTINEHNEIIENIPWPVGFENNLFNVLTGDNPVSTVLIRSKIIKQVRYAEKYVLSQDMDLYLRIYAAGFKSDNIPEYLNFVRIHDKQLSNTAINNQRYYFLVAYHEFYKSLTNKDIQYDRIKEYISILVWKSTRIDSKNIESLIDIYLELLNRFTAIHGLNNVGLKKRFLKRIVYDYDKLYHPYSLLRVFEIFIRNNLSILNLIIIISKRIIKYH